MIQQLTANSVSAQCKESEVASLLKEAVPAAIGIIGQARAEKALKLGLEIKAEGFNVFVSGIQGTGKLTAVKIFLEEKVKQEPIPNDWCYINNFEDSYQPKKLSLPPGKALQLKEDMKKLVQEALQSLVKVFESSEYAKRRQDITDKYEQKQLTLSQAITEKAAEESLVIKQNPIEIFTIPLDHGKPMSEKVFDQLPESEKEEIRKRQERFSEEIKKTLQQTRLLEKEASQHLAKLENEVAGYAITALTDEIEETYAQLPEVIEYIRNVKKDILNHLSEFLLAQKSTGSGISQKENDYLTRYEVNVLVDNSKLTGAPVVIEHNPTYNNLVGRVEKESMMGTLTTDFTMIRKGSLHAANGGYLIIRAEELFKNYFSWEALKRAVRNKELTIEEAADQLGYLTTKTLKPEPIPLKVKIILIGNPVYYHLLFSLDPDFKSLFKVKAEFDREMERNPENIKNYIQFARRIAAQECKMQPDASALSTLVDHGSRMAEDQNKLSSQLMLIGDVLREAAHYSHQEGAATLSRQHVVKAIEERYFRSNLIQDKLNEMIEEKQILLDHTGSKVGQVNGLSVIDLGDIAFGRPNRITSTVNVGKGGIIAIEREAELSGPLHTKGVLILSGYLGEKFFQDKPLSLSARLVFEQSYGEIEGDSASSTELYALLSSLSGIPIKQGIAVTGSVNQKGEVQAIGGVNEKIEGYFEICQLLGLTGEQGVIIPRANLRNLMLKESVRQALEKNQFSIWAIDHVEEGIEILTGLKAGTIQTADTLLYKANQTLQGFAQKMLSYEDGEEVPLKVTKSNTWTTDVVLK